MDRIIEKITLTQQSIIVALSVVMVMLADFQKPYGKNILYYIDVSIGMSLCILGAIICIKKISYILDN